MLEISQKLYKNIYSVVSNYCNNTIEPAHLRMYSVIKICGLLILKSFEKIFGTPGLWTVYT